MVKYPLRDSIESKGGVLAHSASVEIMPGSCALFLGRSGAGKTTVFLEMVTQGLGGLGNDSTLLEPHGETVYAAAWPHIVRIGEGTVRHNSVLDSLASSDWAPRSRKDGKYELFFDTLEEIFERRIVGGPGPVTLVIDLTIDVTGTGFDSVRMTDADGRKFIEQLLVTDRLPTGWLPGWYWQPDIGAVRTVAELLLARVPMYRLNIGVADPRWPHRLSEWLRKKC
jgi:hypothetical protein